ncbi:Rieske iron-sulfur domain-containing protein [Penicillium taxi]|uniref:Rieske iron-sulfur domain-containing protein n=1 Tax=Penicillium taxi TaxID=168475 RepID=UPI00254530CB|nr:Rieske iron-sulfur domain-containing protein [Penicillium taxi]KAJ5893411.1 Rieske iron-sulfur domain-containing protein [Penicillium taxi]
MYVRAMEEDKVLCTNAQKNLDRDAFNSGQLHHKSEKAPLYVMNTVRSVISDHFECEKAEGETWPAK